MIYECPYNVDKFNTQLIQLFLFCDLLNTIRYYIINSNILNLKYLYSNTKAQRALVIPFNKVL